MVCNQAGYTGEVLASPLFDIKVSLYPITQPMVYNLSHDHLLQVVDGVPALVHVVVDIVYSSFKIGNFKVYQISTNYTINGVNVPSGYQNQLNSLKGFDASGWDSAGVLSLYPTMDIASTRTVPAADVHYLALYNKVQLLNKTKRLFMSITLVTIFSDSVTRNHKQSISNQATQLAPRGEEYHGIN